MGLQGHLPWPAALALGHTGSTVPHPCPREPGIQGGLAVGQAVDQACGLGQVISPLSGLLSAHSGELPQLRCEGQVVHGAATV